MHSIPFRSTALPFGRALAALVLATLMLATGSAQAQTGLAFAYGADTEIGGQISFYKTLDVFDGVDGLRVGGDIAGYVPQSETFSGLEVTSYFFEINSNLKYDFLNPGRVDVYGLLGFNYSYLIVDVSDEEGNTVLFADSNEGDPGLNLGIGAAIGGRLGLFGELKATLGGFDQVGIVTGVRF